MVIKKFGGVSTSERSPNHQYPKLVLGNLSDTNDFAAGAVDALDLRCHPIATHDIFISTDTTGTSKFGTSHDNFEHFLTGISRTRPN